MRGRKGVTECSRIIVGRRNRKSSRAKLETRSSNGNSGNQISTTIFSIVWLVVVSLVQSKGSRMNSSKQKRTRKNAFNESVENTASEKSSERKRKPKKQQSVVVSHQPVRCPSCGSTERSPFQNVVTREISGTADGKVFDHVVWKRCSCKTCGQKMVVKYYENRVSR